MKQNASLAVLMLVCLTVAGCTGAVWPSTGSKADGKPPETKTHKERGETRPANGEKGPGVGVAAACAAGGAPIDLAAEGTVEGVMVREGFSLAEIRVDRVLEGDAGETVLVRTSSGTEAASGYVPRFEEGDRYLLYLQRQHGGRGDVFTTNVCLGTRRVE